MVHSQKDTSSTPLDKQAVPFGNGLFVILRLIFLPLNIPQLLYSLGKSGLFILYRLPDNDSKKATMAFTSSLFSFNGCIN